MARLLSSELSAASATGAHRPTPVPHHMLSLDHHTDADGKGERVEPGGAVKHLATARQPPDVCASENGQQIRAKKLESEVELL